MSSWEQLAGYPLWDEPARVDAVLSCEPGQSRGGVAPGVVQMPAGAWLEWRREVADGLWELRMHPCQGLLVDESGSCCWAILANGELTVRMCELVDARVVWGGAVIDPPEINWDWFAQLTLEELTDIEGGRE